MKILRFMKNRGRYHVVSGRRLIGAGLLIASMLALPAQVLAAETGRTVICLDPGHGGESNGAEALYNGRAVYEKDVNLKIARYLRDELSAYSGVEVVMTRTDDRDVGIQARVDFASKKKADYLISLHNNQAFDPADTSIRGCMVLLPVSHYQPAGTKDRDFYAECTKLGEAIVKRLTGLGIRLSTDFDVNLTGGLLRRPYNRKTGLAKKDVLYPDGSYADYYGLIRHGTEAGIPTIIVEHAYICNEADYRAYLETEDSLKALAAADAAGIAQALGLLPARTN